jgi:hypothetical protein
MNTVPVFMLELGSGVWHRPDPSRLPRAGGLTPLCGEPVKVIAQAFGECEAVNLLCNDCEEKFERRQKVSGR